MTLEQYNSNNLGRRPLVFDKRLLSNNKPEILVTFRQIFKVNLEVVRWQHGAKLTSQCLDILHPNMHNIVT